MQGWKDAKHMELQEKEEKKDEKQENCLETIKIKRVY